VSIRTKDHPVITERTWIRFSEPFVYEGRKTKGWRVTSKQTGDPVGQVRWESAWRCYVFVPGSSLNPFFDGICLQQLGEFCRERTREHRSTWKRRSA